MSKKLIILSVLFTFNFSLLTFNCSAQTAYISLLGLYEGSLSVVNLSTNTVTTTLAPFGSDNQCISVSPDGSKVYVTNGGECGGVYVINAATNTVIDSIVVGCCPQGVFVSPNGKIYVANEAETTVSVINSATNTVMSTITVGITPYGVSMSPDGSKVYVTNSGYEYEYAGTVSVINSATDSVTGTITLGYGGPEGITVSSDGSKIYVTNNNANTISVINSATDSVIATIPVGDAPRGICVTPDGKKAYVTNYNANTVSVINTATDSVTATIAVGYYPAGISAFPDGSKVYVANYGSNTLSVINTATDSVIATIAVGGSPFAFGNFISIYPLTGIAPQSIVQSGIEVFPNPTSGKFQVSSPKSQIQSVEVYNIIGEEVFATTNNKLPASRQGGQTTNEIDISSFPAGVYVVEVKTEKGVEVKKFVKE